MNVYKSETKAFEEASDKVAALCKEGRPNAGLRVMKTDGGFKVLIVPERGDGNPFYI